MKLKVTLLLSILDNSFTVSRYSKSFLALENVFKLEAEDGFSFPQKMIERFEVIKQKYINFSDDIPLLVIERYYEEYASDLNKFVYLEYQNNEFTDLKIMDLYLLLEQFYNTVFALACEIADYYNLEVKLNNSNNKNPNKKYV